MRTLSLEWRVGEATTALRYYGEPRAPRHDSFLAVGGGQLAEALEAAADAQHVLGYLGYLRRRSHRRLSSKKRNKTKKLQPAAQHNWNVSNNLRRRIFGSSSFFSNVVFWFGNNIYQGSINFGFLNM